MQADKKQTYVVEFPEKDEGIEHNEQDEFSGGKVPQEQEWEISQNLSNLFLKRKHGDLETEERNAKKPKSRLASSYPSKPSIFLKKKGKVERKKKEELDKPIWFEVLIDSVENLNLSTQNKNGSGGWPSIATNLQ